MAEYVGSFSSPSPPADVFAYLARFSNAAEWDPGVVSAQELSPGPPGQGSGYRLMVRFMGLRTPLEYRIIEIAPPELVRLRAENGSVRSEDTIEVAASGGGSVVTYRARLVPKRLPALLGPLLEVALRRTGDRAIAGLAAKLAA